MIEPLTEPARLAVIGVGNIGSVHAARISESIAARLISLSEPSPRGESIAARYEVPNRHDYRDVLLDSPEGVVIATPNGLHHEVATFFASSGVHLLVEKPLADSVEAAAAVVAAAKESGVHLLVGHHRRHNNLVSVARKVVKSRLGALLATNTLLTMRKPDSYYEADWRRGPEAGPLLVNAVHEIDLLRTICGEISAVQAFGAGLARGHAFDDSLAIALRYESGAVGTMLVTESTPSPWSWEASVPEGLGFPTYGADYAVFLGTSGSLSFPSLKLWHHDDEDPDPGWASQLTTSAFEAPVNDPYRDQIDHFARVIRGVESPVVDGEDALRNLVVIEAIHESVATESTVSLP